MAITTVDGLLAGLKTAPITGFIKASGATQLAAQYSSLWRLASIPAAGAIPAAAAVCNDALLGALPLPVRTGGQERVLAHLEAALSNAGGALILEDRLAHMGGLNGTLTTAQTVNVDASLTTSNLVERIGATDYSELQWWLEWYTATGATIATPTANVTFHDNTSGTVNIFNAGSTALPASVAASRRYQLVPSNGKWIKSVQSVTLSASTATAGSFGVTVARPLAHVVNHVANKKEIYDWAYLGAPKVADNACLSFGMYCITTTTGTVQGTLKMAVA